MQNNSAPLTRRHPEQPLAILLSADRPRRIKTVQSFINDVFALSKRLPDGRDAVNFCADRYQFLVTFFALCIKGQRNYLPPNRALETQKQLWSQSKNIYLVHDQEENESPLYQFKYPTDLSLEADIDEDIPEIPLDHICATSFTSGSTGEPTAIEKSWGTLLQGAEVNARYMLPEMTEVHQTFATVPAQHLWGLETSVMLPLVAPLCISNVTPFFPQDIYATLNELDPPTLMISTPTHINAMVNSDLSFPKVARTLCATSPLNAKLAINTEKLFNSQLIEIYGCTEMGSIARRSTANESEWTPFNAFEFCSASGKTTVKAAHTGTEVELQDELIFSDSGTFSLLGRFGDLINVAGKRGSLSQINQALQGIDGVEDSAVFLPSSSTNSEQRPAAIVVKSNDNLSVNFIKQTLRKSFDPVFVPRPILFVNALPRNETGKLPLSALQALYQSLKSQ